MKFLIFHGKDGKTIKRYQYTAIDDATRVRALTVYDRHTQANAIAFIDHVIARFPSGSARSGPTMAMSSRPSSIGTSRTKASAMPTSSPAHRSSLM